MSFRLAATAALLLSPTQADAAALGSRPLEAGDRGEDVGTLQRALTRVGVRTKADGKFGPQTVRAVRRYERREELDVDGAVSVGQAKGLRRRAGLEPLPARTARPRSTPSGAFPIQGRWTRGDGFGDRGGGHHGVDLMAKCGTPLIVPEAAEVVHVASHGNAGNYVVFRLASGEDLVYMHLRRPFAEAKGTKLAAGAKAGEVGDTGNASACHLHLEVWSKPGWYEGGEAIDPDSHLKRWDTR